jgi:small subunit ribosomal protein S27e
MVHQIRDNRSAFLKVKCADCEHEQLVFDRASSVVPCVVCGKILAEPSGGKAIVTAEILAEFR